jgi:hypothetical protein
VRAYEPGDGEEGGLVAGEEVAGVEDDLRELEEEEGHVGAAGELGRQRVPFLVLLGDLRGKRNQRQCKNRQAAAAEKFINRATFGADVGRGGGNQTLGIGAGVTVTTSAASGSACRRRRCRRSAER